jgi:hypothetical protein
MMLAPFSNGSGLAVIDFRIGISTKLAYGFNGATNRVLFCFVGCNVAGTNTSREIAGRIFVHHYRASACLYEMAHTTIGLHASFHDIEMIIHTRASFPFFHVNRVPDGRRLILSCDIQSLFLSTAVHHLVLALAEPFARKKSV